MRSTFAAIIMLLTSTAVVHAAVVEKHGSIQPRHGYMRAPVGHRQPTQRDVAGGDLVQSNKKIVEKDNELLDRPPSQNHVTGADEVPPDENTLTKMIENENRRIDRLLRSICRGC